MFAAMNSKHNQTSATAHCAAAAASFCACADSVVLTESIFVILLPIIVAVVGSKMQP